MLIGIYTFLCNPKSKVCLNNVWDLQIFDQENSNINIDKSAFIIVRSEIFTLPHTNVVIVGREIMIYNDTDEDLNIEIEDGVEIQNNNPISPFSSISLIQVGYNQWLNI